MLGGSKHNRAEALSRQQVHCVLSSAAAVVGSLVVLSCWLMHVREVKEACCSDCHGCVAVFVSRRGLHISPYAGCLAFDMLHVSAN
jgi:hypothetical protein